MLQEVLLQDSFAVWEAKGLIKKKREYQVFLFEMCVLFAKPVKDSKGKNKYQKTDIPFCIHAANIKIKIEWCSSFIT